MSASVALITPSRQVWYVAPPESPGGPSAHPRPLPLCMPCTQAYDAVRWMYPDDGRYDVTHSEERQDDQIDENNEPIA